MSFSSSRLVASACLAALAGVSFAPTEIAARNFRPGGGNVVEALPPLSSKGVNDIIYEMPPLQPVNKGAVAAKPAPAQPVESVNNAEPAKGTAPAKIAPSPRAIEPAKAAGSAKPSEPLKEAAPAVVAKEAPASAKPAESAKVAETPASAAEHPAAPEPVAAENAVAPAEPPAVARGPEPAETQEPVAPPPVVAQETPAVKEPPAAPEALTPAEPQAPPQTAPAEAASAAAAPAESAAPQAEAPLAANANDNAAPAGAQAPQPVDDVSAQAAQAVADADARIAALLAAGVRGPAEVRIADRATMWLPAGRIFVPGEAAKKLAQEAGLELRPGAQGLVAPVGEKLTWLAPVELLDDGYIGTGEADALQADKILAAFRAGLPEVNAQRAKAGQPPVSLAGWLTPPNLDDKRRLSACVNVSVESGDRFFNCEAWALGRQGAIKVSLAEGGEAAEKLKGEALALADTIVYDHGKAYEDIAVVADKAAPYAVADLLTSDVSAKSVLLPAPAKGQSAPSLPLYPLLKLWKVALFAVVAGIGVFAWFRRRMGAGRPAPREQARPVAARSLFARLLPTLHAHFVKNAQPSDAVAETRAAGVEASSSRVGPSETGPKEKPRAGGLMGKLLALRPGRRDRGEAEPSPVAAPMSEEEQEPGAALARLATKMRGAAFAGSSSSSSVDVSRVIRVARSLPGAAPEPVEPPPQQQAIPAAVQGATLPETNPDPNAFSLIEPGDQVAASAASDASRALRRANG